MSTLTKVLIVLLTISSIFLCGIVVTYVANADNYRQNYNSQRAELDSLKKTTADKIEQYNQKVIEKDALENKLNSDIASLNIQISTLKGQLEDAEIKTANLLQRVDTFAAEVETFNKTNSNTSQMMMDAQDAFKKADAERITLDARLDETSATLLEKLAIIQTLETDKKRLVEEKTELQARMDKILQPVGKTTTPVVTVAPQRDIVRPTPVVSEKIALKGLITAVDLKNKLASISIGTADGVKEGMKFHVTRLNKAICDILIIDADTEEAVGALELLDLAREQPKAGDIVTTNL